MVIKFEVPGEPTAWKRPGQGKRGRYDTQKGKKEAFLASAWAWRPDAPMAGPLTAVIHAFLKRPKDHYNAKGELKDETYADPAPIRWCEKLDDADNLAKFVLDALNKVFYHDDKQIVRLVCLKMWADGAPRTEITIEDAEEVI